MLLGQRLFRADDHVGNSILPVPRYAAKVRLVADLIVQIVKIIELGHDFSHHCLLHFKEGRFLVSCVDFVLAHFADAIDVV